MEQHIFLMLFILGMLSAVQGWTTTFCNGKPCPEYEVVQVNEEYEKREYVSTRWITTKAPSSSILDLIAAHLRLKAYCKVPRDTWPVLVTVTEEEDGSEKEVSLSWFVDGNAELPYDALVKEEVRPAATVYVKVFTSKVNREEGRDAAMKMLEVLGDAAKTLKYSGAGYNTYLELQTATVQHNEAWVYAA